jgi:hypothetical protein
MAARCHDVSNRRPPPYPWNSSGNRSQPTATVFACLSTYRGNRICHRLRVVATARSIKAPSSVACCDYVLLRWAGRSLVRRGVCSASRPRLSGIEPFAVERVRLRVSGRCSRRPRGERDADHEARGGAAEPEDGVRNLVCVPEPADWLVLDRFRHLELARLDMRSTIGVSIVPGQMALMRTPRGASIRMLSASACPAHTGTNDAGGDARRSFPLRARFNGSRVDPSCSHRRRWLHQRHPRPLPLRIRLNGSRVDSFETYALEASAREMCRFLVPS